MLITSLLQCNELEAFIRFHPSIHQSIHSSLLIHSFYSVQCHYHFPHPRTRVFFFSVFFSYFQDYNRMEHEREEQNNNNNSASSNEERSWAEKRERESLTNLIIFILPDSSFPLGHYEKESEQTIVKHSLLQFSLSIYIYQVLHQICLHPLLNETYLFPFLSAFPPFSDRYRLFIGRRS